MGCFGGNSVNNSKPSEICEKRKRKKRNSLKIQFKKTRICLTFCLLRWFLLMVGKSKLGNGGDSLTSKIGAFFTISLGLSPFPVNSHHQEEFLHFSVTGDPNLNPSLFPGRVTNPTFIKLKRPLKLMCFSNVFLVILNEWRWDIHYCLTYLWIPVRQFSNHHPPSFTKNIKKKREHSTSIEDPFPKKNMNRCFQPFFLLIFTTGGMRLWLDHFFPT